MAKDSPAAIAAADDAKWRAENDLRTLKEADAIRKDSKRMAAAEKCAEQEMKALQSFTKPKKRGMRRMMSGK